MKDHYRLNSKQNVFRQAILDMSSGDSRTLKGLLDFHIERGTSVKRLTDFAVRRLKINREAALVGMLILTERLH